MADTVLAGRIAWVTGSSRGLGRVMAEHLGRLGADLVVHGTSQTSARAFGEAESLDQVARDVAGKTGRRVLAVAADLTQPAAVQAAVARIRAEYGRIDILVNNAGWTGNAMALDVTEDEYDRTMSASVKSVFFACQAAARVMIPQGGGKIINIGSNFGIVAFKSRSVYAAAKAAVHHLSRALSLEWAKQGVLVNVVAPCITETESRKVILERPGYKEWATTQMLPAGRWNQPDDLVGAVLFLSSHLSDMVVGHVLMVDGGWTIH
jgi:2-dehydro-3-deoxy-D-gluconate 5-dehydrogenase